MQRYHESCPPMGEVNACESSGKRQVGHAHQNIPPKFIDATIRPLRATRCDTTLGLVHSRHGPSSARARTVCQNCTAHSNKAPRNIWSWFDSLFAVALLGSAFTLPFSSITDTDNPLREIC